MTYDLPTVEEMIELNTDIVTCFNKKNEDNLMKIMKVLDRKKITQEIMKKS